MQLCKYNVGRGDRTCPPWTANMCFAWHKLVLLLRYVVQELAMKTVAKVSVT